MTTPQTRISEIRGRCEHAIDAMRLPWSRNPHDPGECIISKGSGNETVCVFLDEDEPQADFILNAPDDVRFLLATLDAREALLRECVLWMRADKPLHDGAVREAARDELFARIDAETTR